MQNKTLELEIKLQALITEREGMIADNLQREHLGESMAWTGEEFRWLAEKMRVLTSDIVNIRIMGEENAAETGQ